MIKIAGLWELGWNTPIKEVDLWIYPLKDFGVDEFYMTPITGIASKKVQERACLEDIIDENKDLIKVFVDERAETKLSEFKHPKDVLYIFGKANFSPFLSFMKEGDLSIKIETHLNRGLLWPHQAMSIILYNRLVKWQ